MVSSQLGRFGTNTEKHQTTCAASKSGDPLVEMSDNKVIRCEKDKERDKGWRMSWGIQVVHEMKTASEFSHSVSRAHYVHRELGLTWLIVRAYFRFVYTISLCSLLNTTMSWDLDYHVKLCKDLHASVYNRRSYLHFTINHNSHLMHLLTYLLS